jgi:hypothetical protein
MSSPTGSSAATLALVDDFHQDTDAGFLLFAVMVVSVNRVGWLDISRPLHLHAVFSARAAIGMGARWRRKLCASLS